MGESTTATDTARKEVLQCITKYLEDEETKDTVVVLQDGTLRCNGFLFCAVSVHFKNRFPNMTENESQPHVTLKDITCKDFKFIEEMLMRRSRLTEENVFDVVKAAKSLSIKLIVELCLDFIVQNVSLCNYEAFYRLGKEFKFSKALEGVRKFMMKNFDTFRKTQLFITLTYDEFLPMVKSDELEVSSEDNVLESIVRWITDNYKDVYTRVGIVSRNTQLVELLKASRSFLASVECLKDLRELQLISENEAARAIIQDAILYHEEIDRRHGQWYTANIHRKCSPFENFAVCMTYNSIFSVISKDGFRLESRWAMLFGGNKCVQLVIFNNKIYALGRDQSLLNCRLLRHKDIGWTSLLTIPGRKHLILSFKNFIYFFNIWDRTVLKMNPEHSTSTSNLIPAGKVPYKGKMVSVTRTREQIVLFCKPIHSCEDPDLDEETAVYCWDPDSDVWCRLMNLEGCADQLVSFHKDNTSYVLQDNGKLWELKESEYESVDFELVGRLWTSHQDLLGIAGIEPRLFIAAGEKKPSWFLCESGDSPIPFHCHWFRRHIPVSNILPMILPKAWSNVTIPSYRDIFDLARD